MLALAIKIIEMVEVTLYKNQETRSSPTISKGSFFFSSFQQQQQSAYISMIRILMNRVYDITIVYKLPFIICVGIL